MIVGLCPHEPCATLFIMFLKYILDLRNTILVIMSSTEEYKNLQISTLTSEYNKESYSFRTVSLIWKLFKSR